MPGSLSATTCLIHRDRAASARCPSCRQFFCRECITEHEGKLTCASCLVREREELVAPSKRSRRVQPAAIFQLLIAILLLWLLAYGLGDFLVRIPDAFHDGQIWE